MGVVLKKNLGEFRLIYYLFYFRGFFVNDGIFLDYISVFYVIILDVICNIKVVGCGCFLVKIDVKNVFRIIFICFLDYSLFGM